MSSRVEDQLESGFQELRDKDSEDSPAFLIIKHGGDTGKFFQFSLGEEFCSLDFPVLETNDNTGEEAGNLLEIVGKWSEDAERGPAGGEGINIALNPDADLVNLSKNIVDELWNDCESVKVESGM